MKKILFLALTLILMVAPTATAISYQDLETWHWAYDDIVTVTEKGWFQGDLDGNFNPSEYITRAEVAKVLSLATNKYDSDTTINAYYDIKSHWANSYVNSISDIFLDPDELYLSNAFRPDEYMTRAEIIVSLILGFEHDISSANASVLTSYADYSSLSKNLATYASVAVELDLLRGTTSSNGTTILSTDANLTRAEFACLLVRAEKIGFGDETNTTDKEVVEDDVVEVLSQYEIYSQQVLYLVNIERANYGLSALVLNDDLSYVANFKANEMQTLGYIDHISPVYGEPYQMLKYFGITFSACAENIAVGHTTPAMVVSAWMNSDGHRVNILNSKYTKLGIGLTDTGNYWVQVFTD